MRFFIICLLALFYIPNSKAEESTPILVSSTETTSKNEQTPSLDLVNFVMAHVDELDKELMKDCIQDLKINKNEYNKLFRSVVLPKLTPKQRIYFLRPALQPYCDVFYGAHLFRYWLVVEEVNKNKKSYEIRFSGGGDEFKVLKSLHNRNYDISTTSCNARLCESIWWQFDNDRYTPHRCVKRIFNGSNEENIEDDLCH